MAFTTVATAVTGQTYTAANYNTYVRDNLAAVWVFTTAGDLIYATAANTANRLGLVTNGVLYGGAAAPAWLALGSAYQGLRVNATTNGVEYGMPPFAMASFSSTAGSTNASTSATFSDIPNSSATITPLVTSTVFVIGSIVNYGLGSFAFREFKLNIDGTDMGAGFIGREYYQIGETLTTTVVGIKTGVAAGARTIKMRERIDTGTGDSCVNVMRAWVAFAIPEQ